MDGDKKYRSTRVVLGKLSRGKGAVRRQKALLLSYCSNFPLIQLTRPGLLWDWEKLEGLSEVMVEKTS